MSHVGYSAMRLPVELTQQAYYECGNPNCPRRGDTEFSYLTKIKQHAEQHVKRDACKGFHLITRVLTPLAYTFNTEYARAAFSGTPTDLVLGLNDAPHNSQGAVRPSTVFAPEVVVALGDEDRHLRRQMALDDPECAVSVFQGHSKTVVARLFAASRNEPLLRNMCVSGNYIYYKSDTGTAKTTQGHMAKSLHAFLVDVLGEVFAVLPQETLDAIGDSRVQWDSLFGDTANKLSFRDAAHLYAEDLEEFNKLPHSVRHLVKQSVWNVQSVFDSLPRYTARNQI